jgi:hypothetical protein
MKRIFTILAAVLMTATVWGQSPEKMSYQAVIRNSSNALVTSANVGMQISILQGSATGTAVYTETLTPTTNANGLVSIEIGGGAGFSTIDWANGPYFIKTETDPTGGTSYTITGTSQLLSVPYALHAKTAESITGSITEIDPVYLSSVASGITGIDTTCWSNKLDSEIDGSITNEIQILTISNDTIFLTNGNFVKLPEPVLTSENGNKYEYFVDNCGNMINKKINSTSQEKIVERTEYIINNLEDTWYVHSADSIMDECQGIYHYDCSGVICEFVIRESLPNHYQDLYNYLDSIGSTTRPLAKDFYDYFRDTILGSSYNPEIDSTCTAENQYWKVFTNIDSLQKGDLICAKYSEEWNIAESNTTTGHIMMAWSSAFPTSNANEYDIKIFDAASSGHSNDSRNSAPPVSRDGSGIGQGWMRYKSSTEVSNRPIQYLWKLSSTIYYRSYSTYYNVGDPQEERDHDCLEGIIFARPK